MKRSYLFVAIWLGLHGAAWADTPAASADDALVDGLVQEGLLSHAQADRVRAKIDEADAQTPLNKIILSDSIKSLTFYGDGRLRLENINQKSHYQAPVTNDRERYRLRFGLDYTYSDNLKAGFELESGTTDDSANQTFGSMFTKASINVGKIYVQWTPADWLQLQAGKFTNPWYTTTDMVYSLDENPEGGAELLTFHPTDSLTVGLDAVQYLYVNSNESTAAPNLNRNDVWIIGEQIPVTWKINKEVTFKVAPGFTIYTGGGNTNYDGGVPVNSNVGAGTVATAGGTASFYGGNANSSVDPVFSSPKEANDLAILSAPGEFNFKILDVPVRPYWDVEYNLAGRQRVQNVYLDPTALATTATLAPGVTPGSIKSQNASLEDPLAWAVGVQVGQSKKKGDTSGLIEFRQIGLGAVDQNLNGTDFADSYANQQGIKASISHNFTDFLTGTFTLYDTWDYKKNLYDAIGGNDVVTPTAGSTQYLVSAKKVLRMQADLGWKF